MLSLLEVATEVWGMLTCFGTAGSEVALGRGCFLKSWGGGGGQGAGSGPSVGKSSVSVGLFLVGLGHFLKSLLGFCL